MSLVKPLLSVLLCLGATASAQAPSELTLGPRADDGSASAAWIAERVQRARAGHRDLVRLPLVFHSDGWGCTCPLNYLGTDPISHNPGETWLNIDNQSGAEFPAIPSRQEGEAGERFTMSEGMVVRVDGYFTGDVEHVEMEDGESNYDLHEFRVTRIHNRMRRPDNARVAVIRTTEVGVCERIVHDDSPLNVRSRPSARANVVGTLPNGTRIRPVRWRGHRWIRIEAPVAGWAWVDNTRRACD